MRGATQHGTAMFHSRFTHSTTEARPMSPLRHAHGTPRRVAGEEPGTVRCRACWSWLRARSSARLSSLSRNAWIPALLRRPSDWGGVCCVARGFYFSIFYWLRHRYGRLSWFSSAFPPLSPPALSLLRSGLAFLHLTARNCSCLCGEKNSLAWIRMEHEVYSSLILLGVVSLLLQISFVFL